MSNNINKIIVSVLIAVVGLILLINSGVVKKFGATGDITTTNFATISATGGVIINGGIATYASRSSALLSATSTVCSFQTPNATSTLTFAGIMFTTSTTTATVARIAFGANQFATTTLLASQNIATSSSATVIATSTGNNAVIGPSQYLNFTMEALYPSLAGTYSPTGICQATFNAFN